jgi:hypothetical protein
MIRQSIGVTILLLCLFNHANAQINTTTVNTTTDLPQNTLLMNVNGPQNILPNFLQLVEALENGNNVRAIIHFDRCTLREPLSLQSQTMQRLEGATTRFNFTHFLHAKEQTNEGFIDTVTTSMKIFIQHRSGEFVTLSGRLRIFEDNTARLRIDFFDPLVHKQLLVIRWLCTISQGQDDRGLVLFNFF